jgi:monovalent cation/hydrogen antiporter
VLLVWAGMRGAVTVAAAQTLPNDQPQRSLLVLTAFFAAALSLLVQGGTLSVVVRRLGLQADEGDEQEDDRIRLLDQLARAALDMLSDPSLSRVDGRPFDDRVVLRARRVAEHMTVEAAEDGSASLRAETLELRLRITAAQRAELLRARDSGAYSSAALAAALNVLDAEQISTQLKTGTYQAG